MHVQRCRIVALIERKRLHCSKGQFESQGREHSPVKDWARPFSLSVSYASFAKAKLCFLRKRFLQNRPEPVMKVGLRHRPSKAAARVSGSVR
jgi:hypothetical protein